MGYNDTPRSHRSLPLRLGKLNLLQQGPEILKHSTQIYIWSLVSICCTQVEAMCTISSSSVRIWWIIIWRMCRRASRALVDKCRVSSITAQMNVDFQDWVRGQPPFFSQSGVSFRFFENAECDLSTDDSVIHSDPYAYLNILIISNAHLRRRMQNLMLTSCSSWDFLIRTKIQN